MNVSVQEADWEDPQVGRVEEKDSLKDRQLLSFIVEVIAFIIVLETPVVPDMLVKTHVLEAVARRVASIIGTVIAVIVTVLGYIASDGCAVKQAKIWTCSRVAQAEHDSDSRKLVLIRRRLTPYFVKQNGKQNLVSSITVQRLTDETFTEITKGKRPKVPFAYG